MINNQKQMAHYEDGEIQLDIIVSPEQGTAWLNKEQITLLYGRDRSVISKHIKKMLDEGVIHPDSVCAKYEISQ